MGKRITHLMLALVHAYEIVYIDRVLARNHVPAIAPFRTNGVRCIRTSRGARVLRNVRRTISRGRSGEYFRRFSRGTPGKYFVATANKLTIEKIIHWQIIR